MNSINDLPWAAGVLDAKAVFRLRTNEHDAVIGSEVYTNTDIDTSKMLLKILGGKATCHGWSLPADYQKRALERILPYLRTHHAKHHTMQILFFRRTKTGRPMSAAVRKLRQGLTAVMSRGTLPGREEKADGHEADL